MLRCALIDPAVPPVLSCRSNRMSSTHSSSVSVGLIGGAPAAPDAATRTMPTATSCTAFRFGAVTAGSTV